MGENLHTDNEKLKAAYALNMCTVSVSQIVDYNDEYILEQEYDAILNNLNLEQMPKDEALLNILVKLLNVITFFRIDKVKREQIEKKYQRRMKNAIWSAIPNISMIVSGNPVAIGMSIATQVGIGYMNYRHEKANALAEKEDSKVELRITAMEQFNALRRELFTTAWRLADEYNFPDRYRLTERQIEQYNAILMDTDEIRKYERLTSVQDKFEAYLPFWYFMGHSAKYISEDQTNGLDAGSRAYFRKLAREHFEKYDSLNTFNILREDELTASFALEYIDLLLLDEHPDKDKIQHLLQTAVKMAGNSNDILGMCALTYLKIGMTDPAETILHNLVNENYNTETNAKLLSRLYVSGYLKGTDPLAKVNYQLLRTRVDTAWLFPMPEKKLQNGLLEDKQLQQDYMTEQRQYLQREFSDVMTQFIQKYIIRFNRIIPMPKENMPDEYYLNTEEAIAQRRQNVADALLRSNADEYRQEIRNSGYRFHYVELINEMLQALDEMKMFRNAPTKDEMIEEIREKLSATSADLKEIQDHLDSNHGNKFSIADYEKIQNTFSFERLTSEFFENLEGYAFAEIEKAETLNTLDDIELDFMSFAQEQDIALNNIAEQDVEAEEESEEENVYISTDILGESAKNECLRGKTQEKMLNKIKAASGSIVLNNNKVDIILRGDRRFDMHFKKNDGALKSKTLAIIDDMDFKDLDLYITCNGVISIKHGISTHSCYFDKIKYNGNNLDLGWPYTYANKYVNIGNLYALLDSLGEMRDKERLNENTKHI